MGKDKGTLNPVEAYRRSQKKKKAERKRSAKKELLSKTPLAKRDPSKLLVEIEKLRELEGNGRLDGPGRMRRKHLEEQFKALNKAREKAKLPIMYLSEFDPEVYSQKRKDDSGNPSQNGTITPLDIPLPDDDPYGEGEGPPGLPTYKNFVIDHIKVGSSDPSKDEQLEAQVDEFLNEIKS